MAGREEGILGISVASVVEDVLQQQQGKPISDIDFASRKAEEACMSPLFIVSIFLTNSLFIFL